MTANFTPVTWKVFTCFKARVLLLSALFIGIFVIQSSANSYYTTPVEVCEEVEEFNPPNYMLNPGSGKRVDLYYRGLKNLLPTRVMIPDPASVEKVYVEVVYKGRLPNTNLHGAIQATLENGQDVNLTPRLIKGNWGSDGVAVFSAEVGKTDRIRLDFEVEESSAQSVLLYVLRNNNTDNSYQAGTYASLFGYNDTRNFDIPLPPDNRNRDIRVTIPITEITTDGRRLEFEVSAGGVRNTFSRSWNQGFDFDNECCIDSVQTILRGVAGSADKVNVKVISPGNGGQSYVLSGIVQATVTPTCAPLNLSLPLDICTDNTVQIECVSPGSGYTATWDFGEGAHPRTHTGFGKIYVMFSNPGQQDISVKVTGPDCTSEESHHLTVKQCNDSQCALEEAIVIQHPDHGNTDGIIELNMCVRCGSTPPYTVYYDYRGEQFRKGPFSQTRPQLRNLPAGTYSNIYVVDANGCRTNVTGPVTLCNGGCGSTPKCVESVCTITGFLDHGRQRSFWLPGLGLSDPRWQWEGGSGEFIILDDRSAEIRGRIVSIASPDCKFDVKLVLRDRRNWSQWSALGRDWKGSRTRVSNDEHLNWDYYELVANQSTLKGAGCYSGTLSLSPRPADFKYGMQVGEGANDQNASPGMSAWFAYEGDINGKHITGEGDINDEGTCRLSDMRANATPIISCASDYAVPCGGDPTAAPEPTINCGNATEYTLTSSDREISSMPRKIERTWTASGPGGPATCVQIITYGDNVPPQFTRVPTATEMTCGEVLTQTVEATDDCGTATVEFNETRFNESCVGNYDLRRVWTATDESGNTATAELIVHVVDRTGPTFQAPPRDVIIECKADLPDDHPTAIDDCGGNVSIDYAVTSCEAAMPIYLWNWEKLVYLTEGPDPGFNYPAGMRNLVVAPICTDLPNQRRRFVISNPNEFPVYLNSIEGYGQAVYKGITIPKRQQIFVFLPQTGSGSDLTIKWKGSSSAMQTASCGSSADQCDLSDAETCTCVYTRTWTAKDDCSNKTTYKQKVWQRDTKAPTLRNIPADMTYAAGTPVPAATGVTATDACTNATVQVEEFKIPSSDYACEEASIHFVYGHHSAGLPILTLSGGTFRIGDRPLVVRENCDGSATVAGIVLDVANPNRQFEINWQLDSRRTFAEHSAAGGSSANNCGQADKTDWRFYKLTANSTLTGTGGLSGVVLDVVSKPSDPWLQLGAGANRANCKAGLYVSINYTCASGNYGNGEGCLQAAMISAKLANPTACADAHTLVRVFTATDDCGNQAIERQVVRVVDEEPPSFTEVPENTALSCEANVPTGQPKVTDNTDQDVELSVDEQTVGDDCSKTITRTWTAVDDCGNTRTARQVITIKDETGPVITFTNPRLNALNSGDLLVLSCSDAPTIDETIATLADNCDPNPTVVFKDEGLGVGDCASDGYKERFRCTWTAKDRCGNETVFFVFVEMQDDEDPKLSDVPVGVTLSCSETLPTSQPKVYDNCTADPSVVETTSRISGACTDSYQIVRLWTATDDCGNTATASQIVAFEDNEAPSMTGAPVDASVSCSAPMPADQPTFTDNCDTDVRVVETSETEPGACGGSYVLVRQWAATDNCGNVTTTQQRVSVTDTEAPTITLTNSAIAGFTDGQELSVSCTGVPNWDQSDASATDNCDNSVQITFVDQLLAEGDCDTDGFVRKFKCTWTATDDCGNSAAISVVLIITDTEAPVISAVPGDVAISCEQTVPTSQPNIRDNCTATTALQIVETTTRRDGACTHSYELIRLWTATDRCGNVATASQLITVADDVSPVLAQIPPSVTLSCEQAMPTSMPTASDNCDTDVSVTVNESELPSGCPGNFSVTRTFTATDDCGNTATASQVVTIRDLTAPEFTQVPAAVTIQCDETLPTTAATASDNCDANVSVAETSATRPGSCPDNYDVVRTWTATDACGNTATASQVVTVQDTQKPSLANVPAAITIRCDEAVPSDKPTAADNCDTDVNVAETQETRPGNCTNSYTLVRLFTASDNCGNTVTASQIVTVVDQTEPVFANVPTDITLSCDATLPVGLPSARDNCDGQVAVIETQATEPGSCAGTYRVLRTFTATDNCGNVARATQTISVEDVIAPVFAYVPPALAISCAETVPTEQPTVTDNCDANVAVTEDQSTQTGSCAGTYDLVRLFTATDHCGNTATASQVVSVFDDKRPEFTGVPGNVTISCAEALPTTAPSATDNCDTDVDVQLVEKREDGACADSYRMIRTWTATDHCGNSATTAQIVTVQDQEVPVFAGVPASLTISCDATLPTTQPSATDNCDTDVTIAETQRTEPGSCAQAYKVIRLWTATDNCGNSSTASQVVTIQDTEAPVFADVPAAISVACNAPLPSVGPSVTDNCDEDVSINETQTTEPGNCADNYKVIRTWTATDACGNATTASQIVSVEDLQVPTFTFVPSNTSIACDAALPTAQPEVSDNCDNNVTVAETQSTSPGTCGGNYTVTRLWTATDNCGNVETATQVVEVSDTQAPSFSGVPQATTVQCSDALPSSQPVVTDNCDTDVQLAETQSTLPGTCADTYVVVRLWTATDDCGNVSTAEQRIQVEDTQKPVFTQVPASVTLSCEDALPQNQSSATDNCDTDVTIVETRDTIPGGCGGAFSIVRVFVASDNCGNSQSASQVVTFQDNTSPEFVGVPAAITIQCDEALPTDNPTATDNCDTDVAITETQHEEPGACADASRVIRTWLATDACGNTSTASQIVNIEDTAAPSFASVPTEVTVSCSDDLPTEMATATDNCDTDVSVSVAANTLPGSCADSYTVIRVFTATDNCGNTATASQKVNVIDTEAPSFTGVPQEVTISCDASVPSTPAVATDNCDTQVAITEVSTTEPGACADSYVVVRVFTASDNCGNTATASQRVLVQDSEAPLFAAIPDPITISCEVPLPTTAPIASDNCDTQVDVTEAQTTQTGACASAYSVLRVWTATDNCGNTTTASQLVTLIDEQAPVLANVPVGVTISCDQSVPTDLPTASDNCDASPSITTVATTVPGSCAGTYAIVRTFTATDGCGNSATASQTVQVEDTTAPIFAAVPVTVTISCEESLPLTQPTATDNCDDAVAITEAEEFLAGSCGGSYRVIRQWTATDACGNTSTATQLVNVEDTTSPSLTNVPTDLALSCSDALPTTLPVGSDNCDDDVHIAETQQRLPGGCADSYTLVRTFTATDDCGNSATASQQVVVSDGGAPVFAAVPVSIDISCDADLPTDQPTASDDCDSDISITEAQATTAGSCPSSYTVVRTWTASDNCGNSTTASQVVNVIDSEAPIFAAVPSDLTLSCDAGLPTDTPTATDNCDNNVEIVEQQETATGACSDSYSIIRTWTATDDCGNVATASQRVTIKDEVGPVFASVPVAVSIACDEQIPTTQPRATDNCDTDVTITERSDRDRGACEDGYTLTRIWTATDNCGNTATASQIVTIADSQAPVFAAVPASLTISCGESVPDAQPTVSDNCDTEVDVRDSRTQVPGPCKDSYEIVRTWTATDNCGNTATASQVITVIDPQAPVFASVPPEATITCNEPLPTQLPVANDNCDTDVTINETQETLQGPCPDSYVVIRSFTITDNCGNTDRATQKVTVIDRSEPTFASVPVSRTVACNEDPGDEEPVATDDCDTDVAITMTESTLGGDCSTGIQLIRIWTATDNCGNTASASQTITFTDSEAPVFADIKRSLTIECDQPVPVVYPTASDNCDRDVEITYFDNAEPQPCGETITRTWVATDDCGNTSTAVQLIVVTDTKLPQLVGLPSSLQVNCDEPIPTATVTATDNCTDNITVQYEEFEQPGGCPGESSIIRVWRATDACGNEAVGSQTVTITDGGVPVFGALPQNLSISCTDAVPTDLPAATDNCGDNSPATVTVTTSTEPGNCGDDYRLIRTFSATDACGNVATATQVISVSDVVAPVFASVPESIEVACGAQLPTVVATATDDCDDEVEVSVSERIIAGNCDDSYDVLRTFTATDNCGNASSATQLVSIVDQAPPVFTQVPPNAQVGCDDTVPNGNATATDDCDTVVDISVAETRLPGGTDSEYTLVRTWTASDNCGNTATASQEITVVGDSKPRFTFAPEDLQLECGESIPNAIPRAIDDCEGDLAVVPTEARESGPCGNSYQLIRTWTATDQDGNTATARQKITVRDTEAPSFTQVPASLTLVCGQAPPVGVATATDACDDAVEVSVSEIYRNGDCTSNSELLRTYTATDDCGNTATATQVITFADVEPPVFSYVPDSEEFQCNLNAPTDKAKATDNCSTSVTVTFSDVNPGADCSQRLQRVWLATDDCGNTATAVQQILLEDTESPELTNVPGNQNIDVNAGGTVPAAANVVATDNCDQSVAIDLAEETVPGSDCAYVLVRTWTATDNCGNTDIGTQRISVSGGDLQINAEVRNRTCEAKGAIYLNLPNGGDGYTIDWADLPGTDDVADRTAVLQGTYRVTISVGGCTKTFSYTVEDECDWTGCTFPEESEVALVMPTCGASDGTITFPADTTGYIWTWSPNVSSGNFAQNLDAGYYQLSTTKRSDANCTKTYGFTLSNQGAPTASIAEVRPTGCATATGYARLEPASLRYVWQDGFEGAERSNMSPGVYNVRFTESGDNCNGVLEVEILTENLLAATVQVTSQPTCGEPNGSAEATVTSGTGPYTYGFGTGTNTISGLPAGPQSVTIVDNGTGCRITVDYVLVDGAAGNNSVHAQNVSANCGASAAANFTTTLDPNFALPEATRVETLSGDALDANNLPSGSAVVVLSDANGCDVARDTFEVSFGGSLNAAVDVQPADCAGNGSVTLTSTTPGTYTVIWADQSTPTIELTRSPLAAGDYSFVLSDANGCTLAQNVTVTDGCACDAKNSIVRAEETEVCLAANGADIKIVAVTAPVIPASYGCIYLLAEVSNSRVLRSNKTGEFTVTGVRAFSIHQLIYDSLALAPAQFGAGQTIPQIEALLVQGGGGVCGALTVFGARVTTAECCIAPEITSVTTTDSRCGAQNGVANVQVLGDIADYEYTWQPALGTPLNSAGNLRGSLPVGTYRVAIASLANADCGTSITVNIGAADVDAGLPVIVAATCGQTNGSVAFSDAATGLNFAWSDGGTGATRNDLAGGSYEVQISVAGSSCNEIVEVVVPATADFGLEATVIREPNCDEANGEVTIKATNAPSAVTYSWGNSPTRNDLRAGTYTVVATDDTGCRDSITFVLNDAVQGGVAIDIQDVTLLCAGVTNGTPTYSLDYEPDFKYPPQLSFENSDGEAATFGQLGAGEYCMIIKDAEGCIAGSGCFEVTEPAPVQVSVTAQVSGCDDDGAIKLDINGGTPPFRYDWADLPAASDPRDRSALAEGQYTVFITDANGCVSTVNNIAIGRNCGCSPSLPVLAEFTDDVCLVDAAVTVSTLATSVSSDPGATSAYLLVNDQGVIMDYANSPSFVVQAVGSYVIHGVVYNPQTYSLTSITVGSTSLAALNSQFVQGGGFICGGLDLAGTNVIVKSCDGCEDFLAQQTAQLSLNNCDTLTSYCLAIAQSDISNYTLRLDGELYTNTALACSTGAGTQILLDTGVHTLVVLDRATSCTDTVTVTVRCSSCEFSTTPASIELSSCDESAFITLDLLEGNWGRYNFTLDGQDASSNLLANGTETRLAVDTGRHLLVVTARDNSCQESIEVNVTCPSGPGTPGTVPDLITTIVVSFTDSLCADELGLVLNGDIISLQDVCGGSGSGGEVALVFDAATQCFAYTGLLPGVDSLCLEVCTLAGCDTIAFVVTVTPLTPSTELIELPIGESGTYCLDTTELSAPITEVFNFCPDESGSIIQLSLNPDTYCVDYTGLAVGTERACYVVCNAIACDTIYVQFDVSEEDTNVPPVALDDNDATTKGMPVDINVIRNDTLKGSLVQLLPITLPANGNYRVIGDSTLRYTPNEGFCGGIDSFLYVISNGIGFDTATVRIEVTCDELVIFSGFSPNNDGVNDVYRILGIEAYPDNKVLIFNRWGNEVYKRERYSNAPGEAFDGRWDGKTLPDGTYFYVIDLGGNDGCRSGYLQIAR